MIRTIIRVINWVIVYVTLGSSLVGGLCVFGAHGIYPFAVPFIVTLVICFLVGVVAGIVNRLPLIILQDCLVVLAVVLFGLTVTNWSGGDDGTGMILVGIVGPLLLIDLILAVVSAVLVLLTLLLTVLRRRRGQKGSG